jgi:hypothetical protein
MKAIVTAALLAAAAISIAPAAHAAPGAGQICYNWNTSVSDGQGGTLTCKHRSDSGHLMYWQYGGPEPDYTH